jgi:TRAP transporter TAXI family solute receptor
MRKTLRWLIAAFGLCFVFGLAFATWHQLSKPTTLTIAVGPAELDDAALVGAFSRTLAASKAPIRLSVIPTAGPVQALDLLARGEAQLAVIRSDGAVPDKVRAVAILHNDPVVIVTSGTARIDNFGDLKGKALGVIGPPGANDTLVATLRRHYRVSGETRALAPVPAEVSAAVRSRAVDALLFIVPTTRGTRVGESWAAVDRAARKKLAFVALEDAEAIAAATPAYEAGEIAAGQFGGSPALPGESVTTIHVPTYLVADKDVPNDAITNLTRSLFDDRHRIAADAPIAQLTKAASTDKDAIFPVHPGAKIYYDGEETTLMERYGDWLFYGPMLIGVLGSALVAMMRFLGLNSPPPAPPLLSRFGEVIASIKAAGTPAELDDVRGEINAAVDSLMVQAAAGSIDQQRTAAMALALNYVDHLMAERREALLRPANAAGPTQDRL